MGGSTGEMRGLDTVECALGEKKSDCSVQASSRKPHHSGVGRPRLATSPGTTRNAGQASVGFIKAGRTKRACPNPCQDCRRHDDDDMASEYEYVHPVRAMMPPVHPSS